MSLYLEYVPGGSILKLLQEYGPFEEQIIKSYTRKILSGLVFLHERNIAHRYKLKLADQYILHRYCHYVL